MSTAHAEAERWWDQSTVALVTGANKGIGYEIAGQLGAAGMTVIAAARDAKLGEAAVEKLRSDTPSGRFEFFQLDITDEQSVARCVEAVRSKYGKLTILINNAGMAYKGNTFGAQEAANTIAVNLTGTRRVCKAMLPLLADNARIVNVCSMAGRLGQLKSDELRSRFVNAASADEVEALASEFVQAIRDGNHQAKGFSNSMYGISKLAEVAYTFVLAKELKERGIMVNAICPGWCVTDMTSQNGNKTAAEGADTPVWVATLPPAAPDSANFVTGKFFQERKELTW